MYMRRMRLVQIQKLRPKLFDPTRSSSAYLLGSGLSTLPELGSWFSWSGHQPAEAKG